MKTVTQAEFDAFVTSYPRKLYREVFTMGEPPMTVFRDGREIVAQRLHGMVDAWQIAEQTQDCGNATNLETP